MDNVQKPSFQELGKRELLKGAVWWVGLVAAMSGSAYMYCKQTGIE